MLSEREEELLLFAIKRPVRVDARGEAFARHGEPRIPVDLFAAGHVADESGLSHDRDYVVDARLAWNESGARIGGASGAQRSNRRRDKARDMTKLRPRILVVDDNADMRDTLRLLLRQMGYDAEAAFDGNHALEMKIVAMSGGGAVATRDYLEVAPDIGADAVLRKPFSPESLEELLRTL